jgi:hypothetical protein
MRGASGCVHQLLSKRARRFLPLLPRRSRYCSHSASATPLRFLDLLLELFRRRAAIDPFPHGLERLFVALTRFFEEIIDVSRSSTG